MCLIATNVDYTHGATHEANQNHIFIHYIFRIGLREAAILNFLYSTPRNLFKIRKQ